MGGILSKPKAPTPPPPPPPPTPMPDPESPEIAQARRKRVATRAAQSSKASTVLTDAAAGTGLGG